jgi:hypothetical protein
VPLEYAEVAPSPALAPFVKCYWTLRGTPDHVPAVERILPDGAFELVFHFGDPFRSNGAVQPHAMLVGQIRRPTLLVASTRVDVMGVRFKVAGAAAFFSEPLVAVRDEILPLDVVPDDIEALLLRRLDVPYRWRLAHDVVSLIEQHRGALRTREMLSITGRSERAIERAFEDCVGMSAKTYSRLTRFRAYLDAPNEDHGYVDDSHLIHDFTEFAGISPAKFRRETHAIDDAFRNSP